jgi:NitT/TauT family transport system permease protein
MCNELLTRHWLEGDSWGIGMKLADRETTRYRARDDRRARFNFRMAARHFTESLFVRVLSVLICLLLWQTASAHRWNLIVNFQNIPAPTEVAEAFFHLVQSSKLLAHIWSSIARIFIGFGLAAILAVSLGLLVGRIRLAADIFMAPLEVLRPIPAVAWIPLAILMFPNSEESMIFITFVGAFFPILLNTIHGVSTIDGRLVFASLTLGASPAAMFREVIFPGALPSIVTGLSIGMGTSWFSLVTAEMISGQYGIGYYTWEAYTLQNYPDIVLGMITIGLLGMLSSILVRRVGGMLMPWLRRGEVKV